MDERLVTCQVQLLMQRVRDAVGEPAPRLLVYPGASVFRAEFFRSDAEAIARCERGVAAVAPPPPPAPGDATRSPRAELDGVGATPCAPIEADAATE